MEKFGLLKGLSIIFAFCAAAAIASPAQTLTTIFNFNGTDGVGNAQLIQGADGNFYGITEWGGTGSYCGFGLGYCGTIFKMTPAGTLTTLHNFCTQPSCTDSYNPIALRRH